MTLLARPDLVLIDLDGTLVDSVPDLCVAVNLMRADLGLDPQPQQQIAGYVGNGIDRLIHRSLTGNFTDEAQAVKFAKAQHQFTSHYAQHNGRHSRLYPGVVEGIGQLLAAGIQLACVTNKSTRFSEQLLQAFGIRSYFAMLVAGDTTAFKKPHPQPLLHAAQTLGKSSSECLMIGDSVHDVEAARAAQMAVVAVSYGYNHGDDIGTAKPDAVIGRLDQFAGLTTLTL